MSEGKKEGTRDYSALQLIELQKKQSHTEARRHREKERYSFVPLCLCASV